LWHSLAVWESSGSIRVGRLDSWDHLGLSLCVLYWDCFLASTITSNVDGRGGGDGGLTINIPGGGIPGGEGLGLVGFVGFVGFGFGLDVG
jgi:hypothetical protein